jgi:hypothetical protein
MAKLIEKLSARELETLYDKRLAARLANNAALIAAGRGMERGNEIYARGLAGTDSLSIDFVKVTDAFQVVVLEKEARMRWHGSLKPIRRRA